MTDGLTASDIAVLSGNSGKSNDGGFGSGDWGAWIILFLILALFGNRGFGGFGGNSGGSSCATQADLAAGFNNSTVLSSLDDIKLEQANQINYTNQGFAGLNTAILQGFHGVDNAICNLGYQTQQGFNNLGAQLAECCCKTERAIDGVNYNLATQSCDIKNTIQNTTRDIIDNQNCNTRSILDFLVNDKISTLQAENQALKFQASQSAQNAYLVNELRPCPVPAYITCNPYTASYGFGGYGNNGCGCGCN